MREDPYKQRRENRRSIYCTIKPESGGWNVPESRHPASPCSFAEPLPKRFTALEEGIQVSETIPFPVPVLVPSPEVTVRCGEEGRAPNGESVTIAFGTYSSPFSWSAVPDITDSQIKHINSLSDEDKNWIFEFPRTRGTQVAFEQRFLLTATQANVAADELQDIVNSLENFAEGVATNGLDCFWKNDEVSVSCPSTTVSASGDCHLDTIEMVLDGRDITIPSGTYISRVSQQEADDEAETRAIARLDCRWVNKEAITIYCCVPEGGTELLGESIDFAIGELRIGEVLDNPFDTDEEQVRIDTLTLINLYREDLLDCDYLADIDDNFLFYGGDEEDDCEKPHTCKCPETSYTARTWEELNGEEYPGEVIELCDWDPEAEEMSESELVVLVEQACSDVLECEYGNEAVSGSCGEYAIIEEAIVAPDQVIAETQELANEEAQALADSLVVCSENLSGECGGDDCFCGSLEDAVLEFMGYDLNNASGAQKESMLANARNVILPCGMSNSDVPPWPCSQESMNYRDDLSASSGEQGAENSETMNQACRDFYARLDEEQKNAACGEGKSCWQKPDLEGGGGGGGGAPEDCPNDCACLTLDEARGRWQFFVACSKNDLGNNSIPCGIMLDPNNPNPDLREIPRFCYKAQPVPPGGAPPQAPGDGVCPPPCTCLNPANVGPDMEPCSEGGGEICGTEEFVDRVAFKYCYQKKDHNHVDPPGSGDPTVPPGGGYTPSYCPMGEDGKPCICLPPSEAGPRAACPGQSEPCHVEEGDNGETIYHMCYTGLNNEEGVPDYDNGCGYSLVTGSPCECTFERNIDENSDRCSGIPCGHFQHSDGRLELMFCVSKREKVPGQHYPQDDPQPNYNVTTGTCSCDCDCDCCSDNSNSTSDDCCCCEGATSTFQVITGIEFNEYESGTLGDEFDPLRYQYTLTVTSKTVTIESGIVTESGEEETVIYPNIS